MNAEIKLNINIGFAILLKSESIKQIFIPKKYSFIVKIKKTIKLIIEIVSKLRKAAVSFKPALLHSRGFDKYIKAAINQQVTCIEVKNFQNIIDFNLSKILASLSINFSVLSNLFLIFSGMQIILSSVYIICFSFLFNI